MSAFIGMARRELIALVGTMSGWTVLAVVLAIGLVVTLQSVLVDGALLDLRPALVAVMWSMLLLAPALGIRATVTERRSGLWEVLLATPASARVLTVGRWCGAVIVSTVITIVACGACALLASIASTPDWGALAAAIVGMALAAAAIIAWTLAVGALAGSAEAAYALTLACAAGWAIVTGALTGSTSPGVADIGFALSPLHRLDDFLLGLVDVSNVVMFVGLSVAGLGVAVGLGATEVARSAQARGVRRWALPVAFGAAWCVMALASFALARSPIMRVQADWTRAGLFEISPATRDLLASMQGVWRITLVAPGDADAEVRLQVGQVLGAFDDAARAAGRELSVASFDPADPGDAPEYGAWLEELDERFARDQRAYDQALERASEDLDTFERFTAAVRPDLRETVAALPASSADRTSLDQVRGLFDQLAEQFPAFRQRMDGLRVASEERPFPDRAGAARAYEEIFRAWSQQLVGIARDLVERSVGDAVPDALRAFVAEHVRAFDAQGQSLRLAQDRLLLLPQDEPGRLAEAISRGAAAVIEGPSGVAVLPGWQLFPSTVGERAPDRRFRGEEAIAAAMRSLQSKERLCLVLVHAEQRSLMKPTGNGADLSALVDAVRLGRGEVLEWIVTAGGEPTGAAGARRAYLIVPPNERAVGEPSRRERELLSVARRLIERGDPVILSIGPSVRALAGQVDPWAGLAGALGAGASTGGIVVDDVAVGEGRREPRSDQIFAGLRGDGPLARALDGQRVRLPSVVALEPTAGAVTLATIDPATGRRIDREWRVGSRRRGDESLDMPVSAIVAHEPVPGRRSVVIACPDWMFSAVAARRTPVAGGHPALTDPGNLALATQGALWVAGLDELMSASASGREAARVQAVPGLWWAMGVPIIVIMAGAIVVRRRGAA
jgi:ABC-type transport system involved in multi-copper enzyme maturation permease subunit